MLICVCFYSYKGNSISFKPWFFKNALSCNMVYDKFNRNRLLSATVLCWLSWLQVPSLFQSTKRKYFIQPQNHSLTNPAKDISLYSISLTGLGAVGVHWSFNDIMMLVFSTGWFLIGYTFLFWLFLCKTRPRFWCDVVLLSYNCTWKTFIMGTNQVF